MILVLLLMAMGLPTHADVVYKTKTEQSSGHGKPTTIVTRKIKGDKVRTDIHLEMGPMNVDQSTIEDHKTGTTVHLDHGKKTYHIVSASEQKERHEETEKYLKKKGVTEDRPKLQPTGRTEKIDRYDTEEYICESVMRKTTYWFAKDLARFVPIVAASSNPSNAKINNQLPDPASFPGVIIRDVSEQEMPGPDGKPRKIKSMTSLISIKEEPVSDSEFEIPKDYKDQSSK